MHYIDEIYGMEGRTDGWGEAEKECDVEDARTVVLLIGDGDE